MSLTRDGTDTNMRVCNMMILVLQGIICKYLWFSSQFKVEVEAKRLRQVVDVAQLFS